MSLFNTPTGPLKVAGLVDFKKPKPTPQAAPAAAPNPYLLGGIPGGSGPLMPSSLPGQTQPKTPTGPVQPFDPLGNIGVPPASKPAVGTPVAPPDTVAGLFSVPKAQTATPVTPTAPTMTMRANPTAQVQETTPAAPKIEMRANPAPQVEATPQPQMKVEGLIDAPRAPAQVQQDQPKTEQISMAEKPAAQVESKAAAPTTQDDLDTLRQVAVSALNAKEDPVAQRTFNQAVLRIGMANQAQRDALKMQINQDPALAGQPAGTAVLMAAAQAAGAQVDDLIGSLSIESAKRIQDLNQWGFDKLANITEFRINRDDAARKELLAAGDYEGYASAFKKATGMDVDVKALKSTSPATQNAIENLSAAMNRNVAAGNMDAAKRNFAAIQALAPDAFTGLTFEDVITAPDAYKAQSDAKAGLWTSVRTQLSQGRTADALAGLDAIYPDKGKRETDGAAAAATGDLAQINDALKAAGMATVTDKSELIGRGDDVFKALELAKISKEAGSSAIDKGVEMLQGELGKLGYDVTDPEKSRALRSYVLNLQLNGGLRVNAQGEVELDPNSLVPPWDARSTEAHLFSDWPVLAADGTTVIDPGGDPYGDDNPRPAPDSARGQYYSDLDTKWENYLARTAPTGRLTRDQWFYATKAGTQAPDETIIPKGLVSPGQTADPSDPITYETILQGIRTGKALTSDQEQTLIASGRLPVLTKVPESAGFDAAKYINGDSSGLVQIGQRVAKLKPITEKESGFGFTGTAFVIDGKDYYHDNNGKWFTWDGKTRTEVPDPTEATVSSKPSAIGTIMGGNTAGLSIGSLTPEQIKQLNGGG